MGRKLYNRLVRDRIPAIIAAEGKACEVEVLDEERFRAALRVKLVEEVQEVVAAEGTDALTTELADVLEVIEALGASYGISLDVVRAVQQERRRARGGFAGRLLLRWVEFAEDN